MGADVCTKKDKGSTDIEDDFLKIQYGEDPKERNIVHHQNLKSLNKELQRHLQIFSESLKANKTLYKDPKLSSDPIILKSKTNEIKCTYQRPYKFIQNPPEETSYRLIDYHDSHPDTIQVNDEVMQYFGVFLCFVSNKPNLIRKIIITEENTYGLHCVEAYVNGFKRFLLFDDYILCSDGKPIFSQPCKMIYMWPSILEKAWFKIKGRFSRRVQENSPSELFETFLPLPIWKISIENEGYVKIKEKLLSLFHKSTDTKIEYIFTTKKDAIKKIGLSGKKNFFLLTTFSHDEKQYFYFRNPCGQKQFSGRYASVPEEIRCILEEKNFLRIAPGNFILDADEVMQQMTEIMVVNYIPGNQITSQSFMTDNNQQFFLGFQLKHRAPLSLWIQQFSQSSQKNRTYYPLTYQTIRLSDQKMVGGLQNSEGCFGMKSTYLLDKIVQQAVAGKYLIRLKKKELHKNRKDVSTVIFGTYISNIKFDIASQEQLYVKWKEFLISQGKNAMKNPQFKPNQSEHCDHLVYWIGDIVFLYIEKTAKQHAYLNVEVSFPQLNNLQCISHPQIRKSQVFTRLKMQQNLIIIFEKKDLTGETHIRKYNLQTA